MSSQFHQHVNYPYKIPNTQPQMTIIPTILVILFWDPKLCEGVHNGDVDNYLQSYHTNNLNLHLVYMEARQGIQHCSHPTNSHTLWYNQRKKKDKELDIFMAGEKADKPNSIVHLGIVGNTSGKAAIEGGKLLIP